FEDLLRAEFGLSVPWARKTEEYPSRIQVLAFPASNSKVELVGGRFESTVGAERLSADFLGELLDRLPSRIPSHYDVFRDACWSTEDRSLARELDALSVVKRPLAAVLEAAAQRNKS